MTVCQVSERMLSSKDKVLILGSDGVWDRLNSQEARLCTCHFALHAFESFRPAAVCPVYLSEAVDIAARHTDPNAAAREIASIARQRWLAETQGPLL